MTTYTLFGQANPGSVSSGAGNAGTNGVHFTVSAACTLQGVWHYSGAGSTQLPTTIGVYTTQASPATGILITSNTASWSGAAGSGWVYAAFTSPPSLTAGTDYMATQWRNDAVNEWFVTYTTTWPVTSGILTAPQDVGAGEGWYNTTTPTAMTFPASQSAGTNWGMDVQVATSTGTTANAGLATATAQALGPLPTLTPAAGRPTATAQALGPLPTLTPGAGLATATATAQGATPALTAAAPPATATATALGATTGQPRSPLNLGATTAELPFGGSAADLDFGATVTLADFGASTTGWTMQTAPLTLSEFNDETINIAITSSGTPYNLTGVTVQLLLKSAAGTPDSSALKFSSAGVSPAITITNATGGLATAVIPSSDLDAETYQFYRIDVIVSGLTNTCLYGPVTWITL